MAKDSNAAVLILSQATGASSSSVGTSLVYFSNHAVILFVTFCCKMPKSGPIQLCSVGTQFRETPKSIFCEPSYNSLIYFVEQCSTHNRFPGLGEVRWGGGGGGGGGGVLCTVLG